MDTNETPKEAPIAVELDSITYETDEPAPDDWIVQVGSPREPGTQREAA